ncbi:Esterase EstB [Poriferisphaera corsica]|uniref:Esterase EstB n=1 Tax=Poriferisphaera corsica TaxID=2528020 RepID=A0A517YTL9_9BACT|nr:serine hydrolase domain-containing protein [Poriferisphaera corsica]QDU33575.1 Esterase EstB [Poriferisphaera corsica]
MIRSFATKLLPLFIITASLAASSEAQTMKPVTAADLSPQLDKIVIDGITKQNYPGATLIVGQKGRIIHAQAYGKQTYQPNAPKVQLDTIFDMASCSKVVGTTTATLLNLQDKKFKLSTPIYQLVPEYDKPDKTQITVKDLLTHVSGIKAYTAASLAEKKRTEGQSKADALIAHYASLPLNSKTGTKYEYSCLNFQTLARLNENATGIRNEDLLIDRVFNPLRMNDTRYVLSDAQVKRTTPSHRKPDGTLVRRIVHDPLASYHGSANNCPGNAGLFSTAPDLTKYCQMILANGNYNGKQIINANIVKDASKPQTPRNVNEDRGLGFDVWEAKSYVTPLNNKPGRYVIGHTGYTGTFLWLDTYTDTYIIFLTNRCLTAKGEKMKSVNPQRRAVTQAVLKSLPQYKKFF